MKKQIFNIALVTSLFFVASPAQAISWQSTKDCVKNSWQRVKNRAKQDPAVAIFAGSLAAHTIPLAYITFHGMKGVVRTLKYHNYYDPYTPETFSSIQSFLKTTLTNLDLASRNFDYGVERAPFIDVFKLLICASSLTVATCSTYWLAKMLLDDNKQEEA